MYYIKYKIHLFLYSTLYNQTISLQVVLFKCDKWRGSLFYQQTHCTTPILYQKQKSLNN